MKFESIQSKRHGVQPKPTTVLWFIERVSGLQENADDVLKNWYPEVDCTLSSNLEDILGNTARFERAILWYHESYATNTTRFSGSDDGTMTHPELLERFVSELEANGIPLMLVSALDHVAVKSFHPSLHFLNRASIHLGLYQLEEGKGAEFLFSPNLKFGEKLAINS